MRLYWALMNVLRRVRIVGIKNYIKYYAPFGDKTLVVKISGLAVRLRRSSPDLYVAVSSLTDEFDILSSLLPKEFDGLILDGGGYIGTAAIKFACMYPEATVVTIEPSSENFEILGDNVKRFPNIVPLKAALTLEGVDKVTLNSRDTGQWGFTIIENPHDAATLTELEEVAAMSIEQIRQQYSEKLVGMIKLDVEGAEKQLFEDPNSSLQQIPIVFAELHDRIVPGCTDAFYNFSKNRWVIAAHGEKYLSLKK